MLKIIGAALVLTACAGYAGHLLDKLKGHRDVLQSLVSMTDLLSSEIRYEMLSMEEAFRGLHQKYRGEVGQAMGHVADRLADANCENLEKVWRSVLSGEQKALYLTDEELEIVLAMGKYLGCQDAQAQIRHLENSRRQLQQKADEAQMELSEKRKLYRYLGVAVGALVVLVFI